MRDKPNPPLLTKIEFADGQAPADDQTYLPNQNKFIYVIECDENYPPTLTLDFADEIDGDEINSTRIYSNYLIEGEELFSGHYPTGDPSQFELSFNFSNSSEFDYESPGEEGNYSVVLRVLDASGQKQDYEFQFVIINKDEAPIVFIDNEFSYSVSENSDEVVTLHAYDPDVPSNLPQNIDWEVVSPVNVFEFNSSSGGSVQLSFKQDAIPDYEMVNERDWNVTIKVWENEKKHIASRLKSFSFVVTGVNEPPRYYPHLGQYEDPKIFLTENNYTNQNMNLLRHFQDDENNSLSFDIIPMPGDHSERFNLNGSLLEYDVETYGLPDFEDTENQILAVSVRAKDVENVLYSEIITLTVEILQFEESPLVYDEDGVLESFYDTGGILNQKSKPIVCDEDPDSPVLIDHLQFKDPEGSSVSISLTNPGVDDNGTLTISPPSSLQPNYQFSYLPLKINPGFLKYH